MGSRHTLAAALVSMSTLASMVFAVNTAADQTSSSAVLTAVKPDKPLIVVTMLPAGQRQALAVAPLVVQVLTCVAQQQQPRPRAAPVAASSGAADAGGTPRPLHTALSSAADTLQRALDDGAPFRQGSKQDCCSCKTETNTACL